MKTSLTVSIKTEHYHLDKWKVEIVFDDARVADKVSFIKKALKDVFVQWQMDSGQHGMTNSKSPCRLSQQGSRMDKSMTGN